MDRKLKLAKAILLEVEGLEKAETCTGAVNLACLVISDAKELAKLIEEENENKKAA